MKYKFDFDVIQIGSGPGAAPIFMRLALKGIKTCILEAGERFKGKDLLKAAPEMAAKAFPEYGDRGFIALHTPYARFGSNMSLLNLRVLSNGGVVNNFVCHGLYGLSGQGVGGTSLIWANVMYEPPEVTFDKGWPIGYDTLAPYYQRARQMMRPAFTPGLSSGVLEDDPAKRSQDLRLAAAHLGLQWKPADVAVTFGLTGKATVNPSGASQLACTMCGACSVGCPQGAKNTVDLNYLKVGEMAGGKIMTKCKVESIEKLPSGGYVVVAETYASDGKFNGMIRLTAKRVVVSGGVFGTNQLLLTLKRNGYLPKLSDALGTKFSVNGNVVSGALSKSPLKGRPDDNVAGPSIMGVIDLDQYVIEDYANPTKYVSSMIGSNAVKRFTSLIRGIFGFDKTEKAESDITEDIELMISVGRDNSSGRLFLNQFGRLSMTWPGGLSNESLLVQSHKTLRDLAEAMGRKYVPNVLSLFNQPATYHPLGGCPMGTTSKDGVVDSFGRVFNYPGLYVSDGSIVPKAIGRNPGLTILALSERVADGILADISLHG